MTIGAGIAVAGIWIGVGIVAFGTTGPMLGVAIAAACATFAIAMFSAAK